MIKKYYGSFVFIISFLVSNALQAQGFVWSRQVELINLDNVASIGHSSTDVERDAVGNLFMAGVFSGTQKFGDTTVTSEGIAGISTDDGFIAKYNESGIFQWLKTFPSTLAAKLVDIDIDAEGSIFLLAQFNDNIAIDTDLIESPSDEGIVLFKLSSSGELEWKVPIIQVNTFNKITAYHITSNSNSVFLTATFTSSVNISGTSLSSPYPGEKATFIASFDKVTGSLNWTEIIGIPALKGVGHLAADRNGNVVVASTVTGSYEIGGNMIDAADKAVIIIIKFDSDGTVSWLRQSSSGSFFSNLVTDMDLDPANGNLALTGAWDDSLRFDGMKLSAPSNTMGRDLMWLAKFDNAGNIIWLNSNNTPANNVARTSGRFVDFTSNGDLFLSGEYSGGEMSLGQGAGKVFFDVEGKGFVAKYMSDGSLLWARKLKCTPLDCLIEVSAMTAVADNKVVLTGLFENQFVLDTVSLNAVYPGAVSRPNIYLIKADGDIVFTSLPDQYSYNGPEIDIFPNPAIEYVSVMIKNAGKQDIKVQIIDMTGRVLFEKKIRGEKCLIPVSNYPAGSYLIRLSGRKINKAQPLIIQY